MWTSWSWRLILTLRPAAGQCLGEAAEFRLSRERQDIIEAVEAAGKPIGPMEVAEALGKAPGTVRKMMAEMFDRGELNKDGHGKYIAR